MRAFLYVTLVAGVCALQATSIQADSVDSLPVQAEEEKPDRISLPSVALQGSTLGTARLTDGGVSGALLRATGMYSDRPSRQVHHRGHGRGRPPKSTATDSTQVDSGSAGLAQRIILKVLVGSMSTLTTAGLSNTILGSGEDHDGIEGAAAFVYFGLGFGWPTGVYLADSQESSFWVTTGASIAALLAMLSADDAGLPSLLLFASTGVIASELSRKIPENTHNPNPKFRRPDARVSFGVDPD